MIITNKYININDNLLVFYFVKFINVNLFKIQQICYNEINERELVWKLFTISKKKELNYLVKNEKMLNNYQKKIERLSKDKEYCRMIWDERIEQKQTEMIINMYKDNLDINTISKYANISVEEVKKIIKNISDKQ